VAAGNGDTFAAPTDFSIVGSIVSVILPHLNRSWLEFVTDWFWWNGVVVTGAARGLDITLSLWELVGAGHNWQWDSLGYVAGLVAALESGEMGPICRPSKWKQKTTNDQYNPR
jgi:hypothetical protein